jgi:asparagine synthase (glutamine-hydrolysing)
MKTQFGILHADNRIADNGHLATLLGEYVNRPAETSGHFFDGPLLIAFRGNKITLEEEAETQPATVGPYCLTFDGRLDNRSDLAAKIGVIANRKLSDPSLILQAYVKHGDSLLSSLLGEFAFTIWRSDTRELTFCRSVDGARPLFYVLHHKGIIWCSDIAHLVRISDVEPTVNRQYVLEYLLGTPSSEVSPFSRVATVVPGTAIRFKSDLTATLSSLWNPSAIEPLVGKSDSECEELFRDKLTEAVKVRMRARGHFFAESSGGKDSTSVVLTADAILRRDKKAPEALHTVSTVYDTSRTADERYFIQLVEAARGIGTIYVHEREQQFTMGLDNISFTGLPSAFDLSPGRYATFARHMQAYNARLLLTGFGGDHIFCAAPCPEVLIADYLRQRHFREAHRVCKESSFLSGCPYLPLLLNKALPLAIRPPLPLRPVAYEIPSWLNTNGQKKIYSSLQPEHTNKLLPSQRKRIQAVKSLFRSIAAAEWSRYPDLYVSHPYSHRPLIDFCISVPMEQMQRRGETRSLLSRALSNLLPAKIANRKGKAIISECFARALKREWEYLGDIAKWRICLDGFIEPREFRESLDRMRIGIPADSGSAFLLTVFAVERFLRSLSLIHSPESRNVMTA